MKRVRYGTARREIVATFLSVRGAVAPPGLTHPAPRRRSDLSKHRFHGPLDLAAQLLFTWDGDRSQEAAS